MTRSIRRALPLGLLLATLGCSGGLNCGSGCADAYPYPQTAAAVPNGTQAVDNGVRMRLNQKALDFIEANMASIFVSQFGTLPGNPDIIAIPLTNPAVNPPGVVINDSNPRVNLGFSTTTSGGQPIETFQTFALLRRSELESQIDLQFIDAENGIRIELRDLAVGVRGRVYGDINLVLGSSDGACDINGGNNGFVTTLSLDVTIRPDVAVGARCDEAGGTGECVTINVDIDNFDLGTISVEMTNPGPCVNAQCTSGSRVCSDSFPLQDPDFECSIACGAGDFAIGAIAALASFLETVLQGVIEPVLEQAIVAALEDVDGAPLAASGRLDIAGFAPGILPESALDLGFSIAPTGSAFDVNTPAGGALGMDLILKSGFEAAPPLDTGDGSDVPHPCIRPIEGLEFGALYGGRTEFFVPGSLTPLTGNFGAETYDLGASVSKGTINQALFGLYNTGALCLEISSDAINGLTGGAFQLSAATLDLLTQGKLKQFADPDAPAIVTLNPAQPPVLSYGAGTVDEGHIIITWPDVEIGFYVLMFERFARVFAVSTDISLQVAVFNEPGTETLRIAVVDGPNVGNFRENFNELLPGVSFTEVLESLVGIAFDAALGDGLEFNYDVGSTLSDLLGIPIFIDFRGIETVPASAREVLNVYLAMTNTPPQPRTAGTAGLRLADDTGLLRVPDAEDYGTTTRAVIPTGEVRLNVEDAEGREFFARIDFGAWRGPLVARDGALIVKDGKLRLSGEHEITVRSRFADDPNSLESEAEAQVFTVHVDALAPEVRLERRGDVLVAIGSDDATSVANLEYAWQLDDGRVGAFDALDQLALKDLDARRVTVVARDIAGNVSKPAAVDVAIERRRLVDEREQLGRIERLGCASTEDGGAAAALALLGALGLRRRRRSC